MKKLISLILSLVLALSLLPAAVLAEEEETPILISAPAAELTITDETGKTVAEGADTWQVVEGVLHIVGDGDRIDCGDKSMKVLATPGHTMGCMSFIFPVYENGEKHTACLFGGATAPWGDEEGKKAQRASVLKFMQAAADEHCDVVLSNHTAFDAGLARIAYSRERSSYLPNAYIIGEAGVQKFCEVYLAVAQ